MSSVKILTTLIIITHMKYLIGLYFIFFTIGICFLAPFYTYSREYDGMSVIAIPFIIVAIVFLFIAMCLPGSVSSNKRITYFVTLFVLNLISVLIAYIPFPIGPLDYSRHLNFDTFTYSLFLIIITPIFGYIVGSLRDRKSIQQ